MHLVKGVKRYNDLELYEFMMQVTRNPTVTDDRSMNEILLNKVRRELKYRINYGRPIVGDTVKFVGNFRYGNTGVVSEILETGVVVKTEWHDSYDPFVSFQDVEIIKRKS